MNLLKLSWKNLIARPLSSGLTLVILILGVSLMVIVFRLSDEVKKNFENNMAGIDMVVGAKGSPLQLILSSLFHIDAPTGNIQLEEAEKLSRNRLIKRTIPLSYGDSYRGYRIVGTDTSYLSLYDAKFSAGSYWEHPMEVVIGSRIAKNLSLSLGDQFHSAHGLEEEGMAHDEAHFHVTGLLAPTGSVLDQLILTSTESVWAVHHSNDSEAKKEITSLLVTFSSPMGLIRLPRSINQNTNMQAALPAYEINKLFGLIGVGIDAVTYMGWVLVIVAALSVWINMTLSLKDRKYELAMLRMHGARPSTLLYSILLEVSWLCLIGYSIGIIFSWIGLWGISKAIENDYGYAIDWLSFGGFELYVMAGIVLVGLLSALAPTIRTIRKDLSSTLSTH